MKPERAAPAYVAAFGEIVSRIQAAIAPQRKSLKEPLRIFVAGGAAAHLYTGARVSEDIDEACRVIREARPRRGRNQPK